MPPVPAPTEFFPRVTNCRGSSATEMVKHHHLLAALLAIIAGVALRANVVSSLDVSDRAVVLNVPIEIVGADPALVQRWANAIDLVWNRGNDGQAYRVCGRSVQFSPTFTLLPAPRASHTSHLVVVQPLSDGEPFVNSVWHALGTSPAYSPRTGRWGSTMDGATAAHEFGHLLGLLDEYVEEDTNRNGQREPFERPSPDTDRYPDGWFSVMAREHGNVLQRHINEVLRVHGGDALIACGNPR